MAKSEESKRYDADTARRLIALDRLVKGTAKKADPPPKKGKK